MIISSENNSDIYVICLAVTKEKTYGTVPLELPVGLILFFDNSEDSTAAIDAVGSTELDGLICAVVRD